MTEPFDPTDKPDQDAFARELRQFDRTIALDVMSLTRAVASRRNRKQRTKRMVLMAVPVIAALSIGLMFFYSKPTSAPIVHNPSESNNVLKAESPRADSQLDLSRQLSEFLQLETQKAKLLALQQEIESLKQDQANHEWILTRERLSRTEISKSLTAFGL